MLYVNMAMVFMRPPGSGSKTTLGQNKGKSLLYNFIYIGTFIRVLFVVVAVVTFAKKIMNY